MHKNEAHCPACDGIFSRYPGFHVGLRAWFDSVRQSHRDLHASEAGRGRRAQEAAFKRGASKAHYGQSAHNVNMAFDAFQLKDGKAVYDRAWFDAVIGKNILPQINWYGSDSASSDWTHLEWKEWRKLCHFVE